MKDIIYTQYDMESAKIIDDFLPDKIFDAHMHISHLKSIFDGRSFDDYYREMKIFHNERTVHCNGIIFPCLELKNPEEQKKSNCFLSRELDRYPNNKGEIIVFPSNTEDEIKERLIHPNICGLKCYWVYSNRDDARYSTIDEFLPESAWVVANERKMVITLHMVKDEALAHPDNLNYIINMSKKYPDAVLILAHAARAFAPWTVFDTVDKLVNCENVWFDFSCICEVPAMLYIIKKIGITRCMWGSDYAACIPIGKAISLADSFYWITENDLKNFSTVMNFKWGHIITEAFMATRQTCILADITEAQKEDFFYNNAYMIFNRR